MLASEATPSKVDIPVPIIHRLRPFMRKHNNLQCYVRYLYQFVQPPPDTCMCHLECFKHHRPLVCLPPLLSYVALAH